MADGDVPADPTGGGGVNVGDLSGIGMPGQMMGYGMPGQMMGMGGLGFQDPAWTGAINRQRYAMALMQQGSEVTPLRSPWQALARAVQGPLGAYEMGQAQQTMGQQNQKWQQDVAPLQQQLKDAMSGAVQPAVAAAGPPAGGGAAGAAQGVVRTPGPGLETPATATELAALPDVQKLPAAIQARLVQSMTGAGLGLNAGAHFARMIMQESGGTNIDPGTGQQIASKAGALGVAQLLPGTFADMKKTYGIQGDITDGGANMDAGAHYYKEGLDATNGDLAGGAVYYNAGPGKVDPATGKATGLQAYLRGQPIPGETMAYLASTGAPNGPPPAGPVGAAAGAGGYAGPAPGSGLQAAARMREIVANLSLQPMNPYAQSLARNIMAMIPQIAQLGTFTPPVPLGNTGLYRSTNLATGATVTGGDQFTPESNRSIDLSTLQQLGARAQQVGGFNNLSAPEQEAWRTAWARQGAGSYAVNPATNELSWTAPLGLPAGVGPPPGYVAPGGAAGASAAAAGAPAVVPVGGGSGTAIQQAAGDSKAQVEQAAAENRDAYGPTTRQVLQTDQNIRDMLTRTTPGRLSIITVPASEFMSAFGIPAATIQKITGQDPASAQVNAKQLFQMLGDKIQQQGNVRAQALWEQFANAMPSMESTPQTIDTITRMYDMAVDMERKYSTDRFGYIADMRQKFMDSQKPSDWDWRGVAQFEKNWAGAPENDPRVWSAAALIGARMPPSAWTGGLSKQQIALAEQKAAQMYPNEIQYHPDTPQPGQ